MSKPIKFTEEEIKELESIQDKYLAIQSDFGSLSVQRIRVENSLEQLDEANDALRKSFRDNQKAERTYIQTITKKYGDGTLNIEDGTFVPRESTEKTESK